MLAYQLVILIVSVIEIAFMTRRFYRDVLSVGVYLLWLVIWILIIIVALFPEISVNFAHLFGLGRGLDALEIAAIVITFYIMFKLFNRIEDQKKRINELVSELAILREQDFENKDE